MSFSRRPQYSLYRPGSRKNILFIRIIKFLITALILYEMITGIFFFTVKISNNSMLPGIQSSDMLFVVKPLYKQYLFNNLIIIPGISSPKRGDIVIYRPGFSKDYPWYLKPLNSIISFLTFQNKKIETIYDFNNQMSVKRILGIPGDIVKLKNNVVQIKPANGERFLTEFELTGNQYNINFSTLPENWNTDKNPFNIDTEEYQIEEGYYFVIGDNRDIYPDSRNNSLVSADVIKGKAVLRYWPFKRINVF